MRLGLGPDLIDGGEFQSFLDGATIDQDLLAAPLVTKGAARTVLIPPGKWKADDGSVLTGPVHKALEVPLGRLLYFERQ